MSDAGYWEVTYQDGTVTRAQANPGCGPSGHGVITMTKYVSPKDQAAARITTLEAENKRLRDALEPFAKEFTDRRSEYSRRYAGNETIGLANFDKMPDEWLVEKALFDMGTFRRAAAALEKK